MAGLANRYFLLSQSTKVAPLGCNALDLSDGKDYAWGYDFYIDVLREFEKAGLFASLTVYISYVTPESLPTYGESVVLIIVADETYTYRPWFNRIGAILRAYGPSPVYLDGFPASRLSRAALVHYAYKLAMHLKTIRPRFSPAAWAGLGAAARKTTHIPIGSFRRFDPAPRPMVDRTIDFAFLGSLAFDEGQRKRLHRLFTSPKILSRRQMLNSLQSVKSTNGYISTTGDFEVSIQSPEGYVTALVDTRISLVPRGTSYETYRFFESCKAGCVLICEALPDEWCYEGHPGIIVDDWRKLPDLIAGLLADPAGLQERSEAALAYWRRRASEPAVAAYIAEFLSRTLPAGAAQAIPVQHQAAE
jgi:hypothetical protein